MIIDLHTHTLLSDGDLLPSELARRAEEKGCGIIGVTDHVDFSNYEEVIESLCRAALHINETMRIKMIPGVELTHVHPGEIPELARIARKAGARLIVVHGETIVEPVLKGTNRKALESDIDILAHPGMMDREDAKIAAERKISVEISGRAGHSFSNGHVVRLWYEYGFPLVLNTDTHSPEDLVDEKFAEALVISAGVKPEDTKKVLDNSISLAKRILYGK